MSSRVRGRGELRWLIGTVVIVAVLLGISALALDRPNVIWKDARPYCPACRADVAMYSNKCRACSSEFDWVIAPDAASPIALETLSPLEEEALRDRIAVIGNEEAVTRTAEALSISQDAAKEWLDSIGRGRCGLCGGTGRDLGPGGQSGECPLCFGTGACITSGEDRIVRVGDQAASQALDTYQSELSELTPGLPIEIRTREARGATERFLRRHAGTQEAASVRWWPDIAEGKPPRLAAQIGRDVLNKVLKALHADRP